MPYCVCENCQQIVHLNGLNTPENFLCFKCYKEKPLRTLQYDCRKCKRTITEHLEEERGSYCKNCIRPLSKEEMREYFGLADISTGEYMVAEMWNGDSFLVTMSLTSFAQGLSSLEFYYADPMLHHTKLEIAGIKRIIRFDTPEANHKYLKENWRDLGADWLVDFYPEIFDEKQNTGPN